MGVEIDDYLPVDKSSVGDRDLFQINILTFVLLNWSKRTDNLREDILNKIQRSYLSDTDVFLNFDNFEMTDLFC
jgi:hypothetical protein